MSRAVASSAAASGGSVGKSKSSRRSPAVAHGYFHCSELPLLSLVFLLPLIVLYELGTWRFAYDPVHNTEQRIIAFTMMQEFFQLFGATGRYLPAMAVVGMLLAWHIARRDPWHVQMPYVLGMAIECIVLAVPLMHGVCHHAISVHSIRQPARGSAQATPSLLVLSIGAGIYEELVFRLIAFTVLSLRDDRCAGDEEGLGNPTNGVRLGVVILAATITWGTSHFMADICVSNRRRGCIFGHVFVFRGFGITAGPRCL